MFYDVVLGKLMEVDGSSVSAEEDSGDGQEKSQRFRKVIYGTNRLD